MKNYGETLEEACAAAGLPTDVVAETITDFNKPVDAKADTDEFGRILVLDEIGEGCCTGCSIQPGGSPFLLTLPDHSHILTIDNYF